MEGPFGPQTLDLEIEVEVDGKREVWPFHYVPDDEAASTLAVKEWLAAHPALAIAKRPPVNINDTYLDRRSIRLALIAMGLAADAPEQAFATMSVEQQVEWMESKGFRRGDPLIGQILAHHSVSASAFDAEWRKRTIP